VTDDTTRIDVDTDSAGFYDLVALLRADGVTLESVRTPDPDLEDPRVEAEEELVRSLLSDVREVVEVTGTDPETIQVYVAPDWTREVFDAVVAVDGDQGAAMGRLMDDEAMRERGNAVNDLVGDLATFVREQPDDRVSVLRDVDEVAVYEDAADVLAREFDADVEVSPAEAAADPAGKASQAVPFRPAIHLE